MTGFDQLAGVTTVFAADVVIVVGWNTEHSDRRGPK